MRSRRARPVSHRLLGARDDFILRIGSQRCEVCAEPGNPHDKVTVGFGMLFRGAQCLGVDDVDLKLLATHLHVRRRERGQSINPDRRRDAAFAELDITRVSRHPMVLVI